MRLIDATALTEQIQKLCHNEYMANWLGVLIDTQPTVKVEPIEVSKPVRHGEWLGFPEALQFEALTEDDIACSVCGHSFNVIDNNTEEFNYCPHCGAKMREEEDDYVWD